MWACEQSIVQEGLVNLEMRLVLLIRGAESPLVPW